MALNSDRSLQVSGRRRRLIAVDDEAASSSLLAEYGIVSQDSPVAEPPITQSGDRLIRRLISRRLWKHVLCLFSLLLVSGLVIAAPFIKGIDLRQFPVASLTDSVAGLQLFVAGQLAMLISWIRGRSQVDYRGRYRSWRWFGMTLLACSFVVMSRLQPLLPQFFANLIRPLVGDSTAARPAMLVVPACAVGAFLLSRIVPDSGRNRVSQVLFLFAAVPGVLCLLNTGREVAQSVSIFSNGQLLVAASHLLLAATLLHARFVAWICNDPPLVAPSVEKTPPTQEATAEQPPAARLKTESATAVDTEASAVEPVVAAAAPKKRPAKPKAAKAKAKSTPLQVSDDLDSGCEEELQAADSNQNRTKARKASRKRKYRKAG